MYRLSKLAMRMILCTGQRPGEVAGMSWDELKDGFWNIPAARMKGKEPQRVPLTPMVLDIIEQARPLSCDSRYVFRSSYVEDSPIKPHSLARALDRHRLEMGFTEDVPRFTPHDLRRTVRTRLAALGVSDVVAERVLGHKLQGILAVYNRYDYDQEKRQALELWERELQRIVGTDAPEPSNVLPFRKVK
jgi:integrase